jgi:subtilisin family serine protease
VSSPYVVDEVIVSPGDGHEDAGALLRRAARHFGLAPRETKRSKDLARALRDPEYRRTPRSFGLVDADDHSDTSGADAMRVVRRAKRLARQEVRDGADGPDLAVMINVNHVLSADSGLGGLAPFTGGHAPFTGGHVPFTGGHVPFTGGHVPYTGGHGGAETYGIIGSGARQPVEWVGAEPVRDEGLRRRPVVVTLDTGVGDHPWLTRALGVTKGLKLDNVRLGFHDPDTDPEIKGIRWGVLDGALDSHSGHGTFIAGLVRQICPDADIRAVRVMHSNGVADEYELLRCLLGLAELVRRDRDGEEGGLRADVVVLSLGYEHETPEDVAYDALMLPVLRELGSMGVAVVAAAGNNASDTEVFPAAFAPHAKGPVKRPEKGVVPVTSVGSLNPNGTVALFSNYGDWVRCYDKGAALISTMPRTLNGGVQPSVEVVDDDGATHSTLDLDDFRAGFGVWSGTSFAAPVIAAKVAREMLRHTGFQDGLSPEQVADVVRDVVRRHPLPRGTSPRPPRRTS